jgi:hypothetical protein
LQLPQWGAVDLAAFAWARQLTDSELAAMLADRDLLIVGDRVLAQDHALQQPRAGCCRYWLSTTNSTPTSSG